MTTLINKRTEARAEFIAGLRAMADWLEANPAVPIDGHVGIQYSADCDTSPSQRRNRIDQVAFLIGESAIEKGGYYEAVKSFGDIRYIAVACEPDGEPTS